MRYIFVLPIILSCAHFIPTRSTIGYTPQQRPEHFYDANWDFWVKIHNKKFNSGAREWARYQTWISHLKQQQLHNLRFSEGKETYLQGPTKFSDQSLDELKRSMVPEVHIEYLRKMSPVKLQTEEVPIEMNWRFTGWVSQSKSLGIFPYGWVSSALKAIEAQISNVTGSSQTLSLKEVVDCVNKFTHRPSVSFDAFSYVLENGVTTDYFYPVGSYMNPKSCKRSVKNPSIVIKSYHLLEPGDEENLKIAVALIGPISVNIKVTSNFLFYTSGVFYDTECQPRKPVTTNHAVLLVGYGNDELLGDYWIIQNSWGAYWGEFGFARMARNSMIDCAISMAAVYPIV